MDDEGRELSRGQQPAGSMFPAIAQAFRDDDADYIVAACTAAPALADEVLKSRPYIAGLEAALHDAAQGVVPAALLAEARRQGREEMFDAADDHACRYHVTDGLPESVKNKPPPLPAESPTAFELRTRAAKLEAENARLRAGLEKIVDGRMYGTQTITGVAREALEGKK